LRSPDADPDAIAEPLAPAAAQHHHPARRQSLDRMSELPVTATVLQIKEADANHDKMTRHHKQLLLENLKSSV